MIEPRDSFLISYGKAVPCEYDDYIKIEIASSS